MQKPFQSMALIFSFAVDFDLAASQRHQTKGRFDKCCLTRAIGTDDAHQFAFRDHQINVPQHGFAMVRDSDVVHVENRWRARGR